jgi:ABC-type transporter Mla subunit MlaD
MSEYIEELARTIAILRQMERDNQALIESNNRILASARDRRERYDEALRDIR